LQASALEKALLDLEALAGGYYEFDTLAPSMAYTNPDLGIAAQQRCMFAQYSFVRSFAPVALLIFELVAISSQELSCDMC
jgi:hypothetical protein